MTEDPPAVVAEIGAMRQAWRRRLVLACATMAAIVGFFLLDLRDDPRMTESLLPIGLAYVALAAAFVLVVRWAVAHQTAEIRARHGAAPGERGSAR